MVKLCGNHSIGRRRWSMRGSRCSPSPKLCPFRLRKGVQTAGWNSITGIWESSGKTAGPPSSTPVPVPPSQEARAGSRPFLPWEAELVYHVTLECDGLSSLYVDVTERQNGTRPLTVRTAETWELRSGTPKTLSEFFPPRLFWKKPIIEALQRQALDRLQGGESLLFEDVETRVASYFSAKRFYLTEEGLSLFYPMWSLGSPAEGIPVFLLPLPTSLQKLSPEKS